MIDERRINMGRPQLDKKIVAAVAVGVSHAKIAELAR
jgi:hypothetical protein